MYKTVRSASLAFLLALVAVPAITADRWGTDPRPQSSVSVSGTMVDTVLFYLGIF